MARLSNLKPAIGSMPSRLGYAPGDEQARDKHRRETKPSKRWMKTARWLDLRERIMIRDGFTCQMCGRLHTGKVKGAVTIDHKMPHGEDERLFWDENNLQMLCTSPCHTKHKQQQEQGVVKGVWY